MSRLIAIVVHNWPLKLAAIVLSTLLYAGLVLSQDARTWSNRVPIEPKNLPPNAVLLKLDPADVTEIRYVAPSDVTVDSSTFTAFVDLAGVDVSSGSTFVKVVVEAPEQIRVVEVTPSSVRVELDPLKSKTVPIEVDRGEAPSGLEVGEPQLSATTAVVSGPASSVDRVTKAVARVTIQPSGLDVDEEATLIPVDALGVQVTPIDVEPATVQVKIRVGSTAESKTLPINPVVVGTPAAGYDVGSISVEPVTATVQGDADALEPLVKIDTAPVSVSGATADVAATVQLVLPAGVDSLGATSVRVTVGVHAVTATRTFSAGILLAGARDDRTYSLSTDRATVVIGGPVSSLDALDAASFSVTADVAALPPGIARDVPLDVGSLPAGLTVVSISPPTVTVDVQAVASPTPSASPAASGAATSPSPTP